MLAVSWAVFLPACFALNLSFGPNNLLALNNGAREGVGRAVLAALGRCAAFTVMIALTAAGLGALLAASETAFLAVKLAGALYLLWLGVRLLWLAGRSGVSAVGQAPRPLRALAREEFAVAAGNPKAILIFTAFLPQFVRADAYWSGFVVVGTAFLLLELVAVALYAAVGLRLSALLRGAVARRWLDRVAGATLVAFGLGLLVTRRPA